MLLSQFGDAHEQFLVLVSILPVEPGIEGLFVGKRISSKGEAL